MKKLLFVLFAVAVLTFASRAMIVSAQESGQFNAMADIEGSTFLAEFKAEIAESNIIDNQFLQDLNALAHKLNETASDVDANAEANAAVESAQ